MRKVILAAALASIAAPATAQTPALRPPSTVVATVNGWRITDHRGVCSADTVYEGNVIINLFYDFSTNSVILTVHNPAWESIRDGQNYSVSLHFSNGEVYPDAHARGFRTDDTNSRVTALQMHLIADDFLPDFMVSASFEMRMGEVRLGTLSLRGTRAVALRLARCSSEGFRRYPPDPFRNVPTPTAPSTSGSSVAPARARANLASYISDADYPASAIRAGEQGTTGYLLTVGADGRVLDCVITSSSGSAALDEATCRIMRSRARFTPARDAAGHPTTDRAAARVRWVLPVDAPPPENAVTTSPR